MSKDSKKEFKCQQGIKNLVIIRNIKEGTFEVNFMVKIKEMFVHNFV